MTFDPWNQAIKSPRRERSSDQAHFLPLKNTRLRSQTLYWRHISDYPLPRSWSDDFSSWEFVLISWSAPLQKGLLSLDSILIPVANTTGHRNDYPCMDGVTHRHSTEFIGTTSEFELSCTFILPLIFLRQHFTLMYRVKVHLPRLLIQLSLGVPALR